MQRKSLVYVIILIVLPLLTFCSYADQINLANTFSSKTYHYSIHYPANWQAYDRGQGVVIFKSRPEHVMVNIQTIYTKKGGGKYPNVKVLMDDFYQQVPLHTDRHATFLNRSSISLSQPDGKAISGEETTVIFTENGQTYKQWQVMLINREGTIFQAFAYRTPFRFYNASYALAKAIFASWVIDN